MAPTTTRMRPQVHHQLDRPAQADDAEVLAALFAEHDQLIHQQARRFVTPNEVDDVVADTFVNILQAVRRGAGPQGTPIQYVMYAVRTTAWRHRRTRTNELDKARREAASGVFRTAEPLRIDDDAVVEAFRSLSPRFRQVIWWTEVEGLPAAEVGERLGISPNAAAALSYRARGALRRAYQDQDRDPPRS